MDRNEYAIVVLISCYEVYNAMIGHANDGRLDDDNARMSTEFGRYVSNTHMGTGRTHAATFA